MIRAVRMLLTALLLAGFVSVALPAQPAQATPLKAAFTINTTADTVDASPGNGVCADVGGNCSLRAAIGEANGNGIGSDTITLPAGTYTLSILGNNEQNNATGDLDILSNLIIQGGSGDPGDVIIQGGAGWNDKIIDVNPLVDRVLTVTINGVTVRNGNNTSNIDIYGGGIQAFGRNLGTYTPTGTLNLNNCIVTNNTYAGPVGNDEGAGGLLAEQINLTIDNCTFANNSAGSNGDGGAISILGSNETVSITNSTFTGNTSPNHPGGAIYIRRSSGSGQPGLAGSILLEKNVFQNNSSNYGGAIYLMVQSGGNPVNLPVAIHNSVFVGNTASIWGSGFYYSDLGSPNPATVNSENNWWGCSTGPSASPCDEAVYDAVALDYTPWLRDQLTSAVSPLGVNQSTTLTASFLTNSDGTGVPAVDLEAMDGRGITWNTSLGTLSGTQGTIQSNGTATGSFRATAAGTAVIYARVDSDNTAPVSSNVLSLTVNKANTSTAITTDTPDPSQPSQAVSVNYTVTGAFGNSPTAPTGNVTVSDGVDSCTGTVAAGTCSIILTSIGARTLTATYVGDTNFNGSTSSDVSHTVNPPLAITSADHATFAVSSAESFTFTTVSSSTPTLSMSGTLPAGLTFTDNGDGTATLAGTPDAGSTGTYNRVITASNGVAPDATQNFTLTITQPPAITSANNTTFAIGTAGSFTITTTGYPGGASMIINETGALPAGVTFTDNGDGTAVIAGSPAAGTNGSYPLTITAANGILPNATQAFTLGVDLVATTTALTSDLPDPSVSGQPVTFNYTVSVDPPATGTPSGNVTVSDGTDSCTGTVADGSCTITFTTPGTSNFTATYAGDGTFGGSASTAAPHTVNAASTTTSITSDSPDPSEVGEIVTIQYTVAPVSPGAGTPTGNVTISDGTDSCTATVAAGSCDIAFTILGTKSLLATYEGDANFLTSTSTIQSHTVLHAHTTIVITSDLPDPSLIGIPFPVNYSVFVTPPGAGTPTGNMTISDGVESCTASVADGTCSLTLTTVGNHDLTATYAGDTNYDGSISATEPHVVEGPPGVSLINSVADTGDGQILENESTSSDITQLLVVFNKDMKATNPADLDDVQNITNYRLARSGQPDIVINSVSYNNNGGAGPFIATLNLNGGVRLSDGEYSLIVDGAIEDTLGVPIGMDFVRNFLVDTIAIQVNVNGITLPNGTIVVDGAVINTAITEIRVIFSEDAANPANDTMPDDVTNHENYLLVRPGPNTTFDTVDCDTGMGLDDIQVPTGPVIYANGSGSGPFVASVTVNGGTRLENGRYRLFVCGTTSITDLSGNTLNGGADVPVSFIVATRPASRGGRGSDESELVNPATGFAPDVITSIPKQPAELAYSEMENLWIELPTLGINTDITGVPLNPQGWDLTWLNHQVGWLEGTAYPTWEGNTVLTAHNYTPDGLAGPFTLIKDLKYDEPIIIHNNGLRYTYAVRLNSTVTAKDSYWLNKHEQLDWVTLITCSQYEEKTNSYLLRQVVRAVLTSVESDNMTEGQ